MFNAEDVCNLMVDIVIISEHCYKARGEIKNIIIMNNDNNDNGKDLIKTQCNDWLNHLLPQNRYEQTFFKTNLKRIRSRDKTKI